MGRAFITGVTGQDGSYLAEHLLQAGWEVAGLVRRTSSDGPGRVAHIPGLRLVGGDITDSGSLVRALGDCRPDAVYHLAAQSSVSESFRQPELTADVTGSGTVRLLEAVRVACPGARVYQASSSEMFGIPVESPQRETTALCPVSPYGAAKVFAHHLAGQYRDVHGLHVVRGILFNHESPRRSPEFVTRRIVRGALAIKRGAARSLALGNLDAERDWGWAPDYVGAMVEMMARDVPADWLIATGVSTSVRAFAERVFRRLDLSLDEFLVTDPGLLRPRDIPSLRGDATRARTELGWVPSRDLDGIVEGMLEGEA